MPKPADQLFFDEKRGRQLRELYEWLPRRHDEPLPAMKQAWMELARPLEVSRRAWRLVFFTTVCALELDQCHEHLGADLMRAVHELLEAAPRVTPKNLRYEIMRARCNRIFLWYEALPANNNRLGFKKHFYRWYRSRRLRLYSAFFFFNHYIEYSTDSEIDRRAREYRGYPQLHARLGLASRTVRSMIINPTEFPLPGEPRP